MRYLLIYDIVHDGVRAKVANACLDYGLLRIQYSAFMGELTHTHQRELWLKIERRVDKHSACIHLYALDERTWNSRRLLDQREDRD